MLTSSRYYLKKTNVKILFFATENSNNLCTNFPLYSILNSALGSGLSRGIHSWHVIIGNTLSASWIFVLYMFFDNKLTTLVFHWNTPWNLYKYNSQQYYTTFYTYQASFNIDISPHLTFKNFYPTFYSPLCCVIFQTCSHTGVDIANQTISDLHCLNTHRKTITAAQPIYHQTSKVYIYISAESLH